MKPFQKNELRAIVIIFALVAFITFQNLLVSLRRARDSQRKADMGAVSDALHAFYEDFGFFPPSENGKIKACKGDNFESVVEKLKANLKFDRGLFFEGLRVCEWGKDSFSDVLDPAYPPYISILPLDPRDGEGFDYYYLSNTRRFQIFSYLEGEEAEEGYDKGIAARNLPCGINICSYGKTFLETPLNRSIEDYEEELSEREKTGKL